MRAAPTAKLAARHREMTMGGAVALTANGVNKRESGAARAAVVSEMLLA